MLIPSALARWTGSWASLSRRVNANSQQLLYGISFTIKLIKKGEC